ncbi:unnamed protein product [Anisakis simplex]|uniref:ECSIT domain-containing protein n=1 Tax=Anisakis simplex TaxID=6269 RepID=A0A0M3J2I8_ANISI|nr:unnamed protein product [Anisakis simplex]
MNGIVRTVNEIALFRLTSVFNKQLWRSASNSAVKKNRVEDDRSERSLQHIDEHFEAVPAEERNKKSFNAAIEVFRQKRTQSRGHVEFINSALKYLEEYGLHKDLDTYKSLLNVFPKGAMIPQNKFQVVNSSSYFQKIFLHYPMQQNCCVKVLDQMEWFGEFALHPSYSFHFLLFHFIFSPRIIQLHFIIT